MERDLDLTKAIEIATSMEEVEIKSRMMSSSENSSADTKSASEMDILKINLGKRRCYRCNDESHLANKCKHRNSKCDKCHRIGHLARA